MAEEEISEPIEFMEDDPMEWTEFLSSAPPYARRKVRGVADDSPHGSVDLPRLRLVCDSEVCEGGIRIFVPSGSEPRFSTARQQHSQQQPVYLIVHYVCKHCDLSIKTFAIELEFDEKTSDVHATKLGEVPPFGPGTPPRLLRLVQSDRELYLKGRRAESQGLGIGAFAYYRRVVENQKDRLIDEIIKVSKRLNADPGIVSALEAAKTQFQFGNAIDDIQDAIPESLRIEGQNPLILLHAALSKGIHSRSDEECLEFAQSIRLVLTNLAERIDQALQKNDELSEAVKRLQAGSRKKAQASVEK